MPKSLPSRPVTMVARLGGGVGLAGTWDHLRFFPFRTSGVAERGEEGVLGGICARFALSASGGGAGAREPPPAPPPLLGAKEQGSVAALDQSPRRSSP